MDRRRWSCYRRWLGCNLPVVAVLARRIAIWGLARAVRRGDEVAARDLAEHLVRHGLSARSAAGRALAGAKDQSVVNTVCMVWYATRNRTLAQLLKECGWVASGPARLRVLTALRCGRFASLSGESAAIVPLTLIACEDSDRQIAAAAPQLLCSLTREDAISDLCHAALNGNVHALRAAVESGYLPADARSKALYPQLALYMPPETVAESCALSPLPRVPRRAQAVREACDSAVREEAEQSCVTIKLEGGTVTITPVASRPVDSLLSAALQVARGVSAWAA
ncbi:MAG: hypothetical protein WD176_08115 [Pirellulales bacterium]